MEQLHWVQVTIIIIWYILVISYYHCEKWLITILWLVGSYQTIQTKLGKEDNFFSPYTYFKIFKAVATIVHGSKNIQYCVIWKPAQSRTQLLDNWDIGRPNPEVHFTYGTNRFCSVWHIDTPFHDQLRWVV